MAEKTISGFVIRPFYYKGEVIPVDIKKKQTFPAQFAREMASSGKFVFEKEDIPVGLTTKNAGALAGEEKDK